MTTDNFRTPFAHSTLPHGQDVEPALPPGYRHIRNAIAVLLAADGDSASAALACPYSDQSNPSKTL